MVDAEKIAAVIAEIADHEIAQRFGNLKPEEIREKSSASDLVTEVDEAAERALTSVLNDIYPAATVIGEESAAANPDSVNALDSDGAFWIVDPLDGTRNFVRGEKEFATIVALVEDGVTRMGWIYAIPERKCAIAIAGEGGFWDGVKIDPKPSTSERSTGLRSVGWLTPEWEKPIRENLKANFDCSANHCSAYGYLKVAHGDVDFKLSSRIHPWDHAAGALLVRETGGRAAYIDNATPYSATPSIDRPLLVAAQNRDWKIIAGALRGDK